MNNKQTVLITGGAGFIGAATARELLERGDDVVLVDNFCDYYEVSLKRDRVSALKDDYENVVVEEVDITDYNALEKVFKKYQPTKICHLAAQPGVRYSLENPFVYEQTNYLGMLNLLELCRHNGVSDFIYASSSSVYGNNKKVPFSEEDRVDTPISLYAATKKATEEMAYTYHHLFGLNCTGLRFFTVYGPWSRPDMALFLFTKNIFEGKPIKVFNNGEMHRDFTYISDIVSGVIASIDKAYPYEIFNLARGETVKLLDYIEAIEKAAGREAIKNMMPIQPGDMQATSADISKAKEKLAYEPKVSVIDGVKDFVNWYRGYYEVN